MNQQDIQTFLAIVHCKSFSKTANSLYTSQTAISHRILALEKELGYPLFVRQQGIRSVELTQQGKQFVPLAEQWETIWNITQKIGSTNYRTPLFIGANERLNAHLLPEFYRRCSANVLDSSVLNIRTYHSLEIIELVDRKELDIGMVGTDPNLRDLVTIPFLNEPLVMICHHSDYYPAGPVSPLDLDLSDSIQITSNAKISSWRNLYWKDSVQPIVSVDSYELIANYLAAPGQWSTCPKFVAESLAARFPIDIHPFSVEVPMQESYIIFKRHIRMEKLKAVQDFLLAFQEYCAVFGEASPLVGKELDF